MTLKDVYNMLASLGLPVYYDHVTAGASSLPFICYKEVSSNVIVADNVVQAKTTTIQIELYTRTKDVELEERLEAELKRYPYRKTLDFDDDEEFYISYYTIEI